MNLNYNPDDYPGAELLHFHGFCINIPSKKLEDDEINDIVDVMLNFDKI